MPKATLEFDLNDEQDAIAHKLAVSAFDLAVCLLDMDNHLRAELKYNDEKYSQETYDALDATREKLHYIMGERGVNLDSLII